MPNAKCYHLFKTVYVETEVINDPKMGPVRREHRECIKCSHKQIDYLAVGHRYSSYFTIGTRP